jgi:hypothetical protein
MMVILHHHLMKEAFVMLNCIELQWYYDKDEQSLMLNPMEDE